MKNTLLLLSVATVLSTNAMAQSHTCPSMFSRNNGNGQANSCPGVNSTPVASNVSGTAFATVPSGNKTADIIFEFASNDPWKTAPPVITSTYQTTSGSPVAINTFPGPPGVPTSLSSGKTQSLYCSYTGSTGNGNMPNAGVVSFVFNTPGSTTDKITCSYNFSSSNVAVSNPVALPIQFYSFEAQQTPNGTRLTWNTSVDRNASFFEIERSLDGVTYTSVGRLHAENSANGIASYTFVDGMERIEASGNIYYRIKQVDNDGTFIYSDTKSVRGASWTAQQLEVAVHGTELVVKSAANQEADLQLISANGQLIAQWHTTLSPGLNKLGGIQQGIGIIRVVTKENVAITRY